MRIALFHNTPSGGAKRAIFEWTRRLTRNHHIDVFTLNSADHEYCDIRPYVQSYHIFDFVPKKLFTSPFGRINAIQRWRDLGSLTKVGKNIAAEINRAGYDVLFANTCLFTFIPTVLQFVNIPSIYYLHEPFGNGFVRNFKRHYLKNDPWRGSLNRIDPVLELYHRRLNNSQRKSISRTNMVLANSTFTKECMKNLFGLDTPICYLGVDSEAFHPIPGVKKENHILSVGELSPRKGFDFIIESLKLIPPESRPQLRLVCNKVDLNEKNYVESLAVQYDVDLQILTNLNTNEMICEYNKAQICVYTPVLEPFGLVPLEAMACGLPVIGVREGGVQESIVHDQTGLLVDRDPHQFARAIQHLFSNPGLISDFSRNGREYVLKYWTWDRAVNRLEEHFAAVV
ncbi:MAG: glycosyltransferase family 4 protein [Anaerolineales bacterium]